jgi:hypothetical protein
MASVRYRRNACPRLQLPDRFQEFGMGSRNRVGTYLHLPLSDRKNLGAVVNNREFKKLEVGDIVTSLLTGNAYVVTQRTAEDEVIGVRTVTISNPSEWKLFKGEKKK